MGKSQEWSSLDLDLESRRFTLSATLRGQLEALAPQQIDVCRGPAELTVDEVRPDLICAMEAWPPEFDSFRPKIAIFAHPP